MKSTMRLKILWERMQKMKILKLLMMIMMMMMKMTVIQIVHLMITPGNSCQIFSLHYALIEVFKKIIIIYIILYVYYPVKYCKTRKYILHYKFSHLWRMCPWVPKLIVCQWFTFKLHNKNVNDQSFFNNRSLHLHNFNAWWFCLFTQLHR